MIVRIAGDSPVPPYAQIQEQVTTMIRSGVLPPGTRLPAIRHLARDLDLAVGTVGRAYRELEQAGMVATRGRHGTVVLAPSAAQPVAVSEAVDEAAVQFALHAVHRGVELDAAIAAVRQAFRGLRDVRSTS